MTSLQKAVLYDEVGAPTVLHLAEVPTPVPGDERVLLEVRDVGINPYDAKVLSGRSPRNADFPRGIGGDVAGVVSAVGAGAVYADGTAVQVGDAVFGWGVNTMRQFVVVRAVNMVRVPQGLSFEKAGSLATPAFAANALVHALALPASGTILVSGATGMVGSLVAQWGVRQGLRVLGTVSARNFDRARALGVEPIEYGDGLGSRLASALGDDTLAAVYDTVGEETLAAAVHVNARAMVTIAGDEVAERFGAISTTTTSRDVTMLASLAADIATGAIVYEVARSFELADVVAAFELLETGHPQGKVVLHVS
ncbi:NADP-dependent oxidoreductase [Microbacterium mitrae]|uniref:NADP-dependent oxidoreductase n=1 Tax=Microbacterium mitrae TaxID=664640 RepID=A0A5C8HTC4_9MICO|nr:NADP-dependent oxidoreductase [Microbacterium mitrae]TXK06569.1 NADP-dependent oxidoreductase [Microbacterium mitrae]